MKKILKLYLISLLSLIFAWQYVQGIVLTQGFESLLIAAAVLVFLDKLVKPIVKVITFPIKFITFGLSDILLTILVFYLATNFTRGLEIVEYTFQGFSSDFLIIPQFDITYPLNYVVSAFVVVIFNRIFSWILKGKVIEADK